MKSFCRHRNSEQKTMMEVYKVKGEKIEILATVRQCKECGEILFDPELDDKNIRAAYTVYKDKHGLLTTDEIISIRKRLNLPQASLALLIGCTQATVARYEKGALQDEAYDNLLRMLENPDNVENLMHRHRDKMSARDCARIESAISKMRGKKASSSIWEHENLLLEICNNLENKRPTEYNGFTLFDFQKFAEMVVFFAHTNHSLSKEKLLKLLWYSDMVCFKKTAKAISGLQYIHKRFGPVPDQYMFLLGLLEVTGEIRLEEDQSEIGNEQVIPGHTECDMMKLSKTELCILQNVVDHFQAYSAEELSDESHEEEGYKQTAMMDVISFKYAFDMEDFSA